MDEDISRLKTTAIGLLTDLGCNGSTLTEDLINEICRFGAAELHAVAAFIGGITSQEVIKVVRLISIFVSKKEQYTYLVVLHFRICCLGLMSFQFGFLILFPLNTI